MNRKIIVALVALIAIGLAGWYLQRDSSVPPTTTAVPEVAPMPTPQPVIRDEPEAATPTDAMAPVATVQLPALGDSDGAFRSAAGELAQKLMAWLVPEEQIRKWVVAVDLAADGVLMEKNRPLAYPMSAFKVSGGDGDYRPDAANFGRTNELIDTLTAIEPARVAAYYQSWRPLFEEAYKELGKPGNFDARLKLAIDRTLAVKPLSGTPTLVRPKVYYRYADPKLEGASDIEKLLWRLGPDNSAKLQGWLKGVRDSL